MRVGIYICAFFCSECYVHFTGVLGTSTWTVVYVTQVYVYTNVHICEHTPCRLYTSVYMYMCVCVYAYAYGCVCASYTHTHTHVFAWMRQRHQPLILVLPASLLLFPVTERRAGSERGVLGSERVGEKEIDCVHCYDIA